MNDSDSSDTGSEGWQEEESNSNDQITKCIFSDRTFPSPQDYFLHLKNERKFDIWHLVHVEFNLDFFGYVKLINFLRSEYFGLPMPQYAELHRKREVWKEERYLKPVVEDDALLQFMLDDGDDDDEAYFQSPLCVQQQDSTQQANGCGEQHTINTQQHNDPQTNTGGEGPATDVFAELNACRTNNLHLRGLVTDLNLRVNEMKRFMKDVVLKGDIYRPVAACRKQPTDSDDDEDEEFEDSGYYRTYAHHSIHGEMLQDRVRTGAYQDAIINNHDLFKDKTVLDIGCGTGILSMFAARAGAKHVYAVERSDIACQAMDVILENSLDAKITVIHASVEEAELPVDQVDIIVSEWMGYFLLYESMLDSVLHAADRWLAPGGIILPDRFTINLVAIDDQRLYESQVAFWDDVYGFKMSCCRTSVLAEAGVHAVDPNAVVSTPAPVFRLDTGSVCAKGLDFGSDFELTVVADGRCTAIAGYFDCLFDLPKQVRFSTGPHSVLTHWKQTVFFLREPLTVSAGEIVRGRIDCRKNPADPRALLVDLIINDVKQPYMIS